MSATSSRIYQYIAPAHRAVWRGDIFWWLSLVFLYAINPKQHTLADLSVFIVIFFGLSVFHIVREYRHPQSRIMYGPGQNAASITFGIGAAVGTILWAASYWLLRYQTNWSLLLLALAATGAAYLLRPAPVTTD